jgi:ribonucleoside-diphosphate reductase alpha chain
MGCGEQPLLPYESCNLGSIDVSKFVKDGKIDYESLEGIVKNSIHFLDNVVDMNHAPIEQINQVTRANRKVGLGLMGFADALIYMGVPYGSQESTHIAEQLTKFIQDKAKEASRELAKERGSFPNINLSIYKGQDMRNATVTTIAPTGTIGVITGCSQGIEPLYSVVLKRKTPQFTLLESNKAFETALRKAGIEPTRELLEEILNKGPKGVKGIPPELSDIFVTAGELTPDQHLKVQAAFQKYIDNAVSKTINFPNNATVQDIEHAYRSAHRLGLKGVTIYRDGSRDVQVLNVGPDKEHKSLQTILTEEAVRAPRPEIIKGETLSTITPFGKLFITINRRQDGVPYEMFLAIGKSGGDVQAMAEGYGRLLSMQLKAGATLEDVAEQLEGIGGKTTVRNEGHSTSSLPDAVAQTIRKHIKHYKEGNGHTVAKEEPKISGNLCPTCGSPLIRGEGCEKCSDAGCTYTRCG